MILQVETENVSLLQANNPSVEVAEVFDGITLEERGQSSYKTEPQKTSQK